MYLQKVLEGFYESHKASPLIPRVTALAGSAHSPSSAHYRGLVHDVACAIFYNADGDLLNYVGTDTGKKMCIEIGDECQ